MRRKETEDGVLPLNLIITALTGQKAMKIKMILLVFLGIISFFFGCGEVGEDCCMLEFKPASFVSATPPTGEIAPNTIITVTFDGIPAILTASAGTVTVYGEKATISGLFPLGKLTLTLTWADGTQVLNYTVKGPDQPESAP